MVTDLSITLGVDAAGRTASGAEVLWEDDRLCVAAADDPGGRITATPTADGVVVLLHRAPVPAAVVESMRSDGPVTPAMARALGTGWVAARWRPSEDRLEVFADPLARRPVHWNRTDGVLRVHTDLVALLDQLPARRVDTPSVAAALVEGRTPAQPASLYESMATVPAGHVLTATGSGDPAVTRWWEWQAEPDEPASDAEVRSAILDALAGDTDASDAVLLSGGLDSSMLAGMASAGTALTIRYDGLPCDETRFQDAVVDHLGLREIAVGVNELDPELDLIAPTRRTGLPVRRPDPDVRALYAAASDAGVTTVVTGLGGDELFARYPDPGRYQRVRSAAVHLLPPSVRRVRRRGGLSPWVRPDALRSWVPDDRPAISTALGRRITNEFTGGFPLATATVIDRQERVFGIVSSEPLRHLHVIETALRVPNADLATADDPRAFQRAVAAPVLPPAIRERRSKPHFDPVYIAQLAHPWVGEATGEMALADAGLVEPAALRVEIDRLLGELRRDPWSITAGVSRVWQTLGLEVWLRTVTP